MKVAQPIDVVILRSMRAAPVASVFSPRYFVDFGSPEAVRKALSRLVKAGKIRRIRRVLYDLPQPHPIAGQTAPNIMATVGALMESSHVQWQFTGAYAANALGLSDQVPAKIVILTDGVPRKVALGKLTLVFRRAAQSARRGPTRRVGNSSVALSEREFRDGGEKTTPEYSAELLRAELARMEPAP